MNEITELLNAYREEAVEFIDALSVGVGELAVATAERRVGLVPELLRTAHNLKGGAYSVGDDEVGQLAHALEEALSEACSASKRPSLEQLDQLRALVHELEARADAGLSADSTENLAARLGLQVEPETSYRRAGEEPEEVRLRVEGHRLDLLMSSAEELLVTHARFAAGQERLRDIHRAMQEAILQGGSATAALEDLSRQLGQILQGERRGVADFGQLAQETNRALKRVRMLPLRDYAPRWRRIVREASAAAEREVTLEVAVGDLELDKHLIDNLRDPFMHLLRNAVGHGIETAEEREAAGKPPAGTIRVSAAMQGSRVRLEIADDGRGLDMDRLRARALAMGIADEKALAELDPEDVQGFIFRDGFSTTEQADRLSGRGVGMSVVQRQVERVGGSVAVRCPDRGTTFVLDLPPSILSVPGLLVRTKQAVYAVPVDNVARTVRLDRERTGVTGEGMAFRLPQSDEPVRVVALESLLGTGGAEERGADHVVVLEHRGRRLGLLVHEVLGQQEFVTKPLPWNIGAMPGINGATVLADRGAALVLDVSGLMELASHATGGGTKAGPEVAEAPGGPKRVLVVDDSLASRTLERNMLINAGFEVSTCVDGSEALQRLGRERFDLVVSDIQMPAMDGLELTRRIRAHGKLSTLPVILVTSLGRPEDVTRGADVGADEYIVKGQFDQRRLVEAVRRLV